MKLLFPINSVNGAGSLTDGGTAIEGGFTTTLARMSFRFVRP